MPAPLDFARSRLGPAQYGDHAGREVEYAADGWKYLSGPAGGDEGGEEDDGGLDGATSVSPMHRRDW